MAVTLSNIINILAEPMEAFNKIVVSPKWISAFSLITIIVILCGFFMLPFSERIIIKTLLSRMDTEQAQQAMLVYERFQYVGILFSAVPLLIKWIFLSAFLYYGAILLNAQNIRYRSVFTIVVYSEFILLLMGIINLLLLYIRGVDSINSITDLQAIVGLDYFLNDKQYNIPFYTFLNNFNVFSIWYVVTLTIGISIATCFSKLKSAILVSTTWLLCVGFQVASTIYSANIQNMMEG
jgi:hypothetical protein